MKAQAIRLARGERVWRAIGVFACQACAVERPTSRCRARPGRRPAATVRRWAPRTCCPVLSESQAANFTAAPCVSEMAGHTTMPESAVRRTVRS